MSIHFRCERCNRLLAAADNAGGKRSKCPECGHIMRVPQLAVPPGLPPDPTSAHDAASPRPSHPDVPPAGPRPPRPPSPSQTGPTPDQPYTSRGGGVYSGHAWAPPGQDVNPYGSPTSGGYEATTHEVGRSNTLGRAKLDVGDALNTGWEVLVANMGGLVIENILFIVIIMLGYGACLIPALVLASMDLEPLAAPAMLFGMLAWAALGVWLTCGHMLYSLKTARGEQPDFGVLFQGGRFVLPMFVGGLLFMVCYLVGSALCIVPGVIAATMLSQFAWLIVDERTDDGFQSLKMSMQTTEGNRGTLFVIWFLASLIASAATVMTCYLAIPFVYPWITMVAAVVYLRITGQPVAGQPAPSSGSDW